MFREVTMRLMFLIGSLCLFWICDARHLTGCVDSHVWIAGGSVDCKYLYTASAYGLHNKAEYFCTKYPQTYCCDTCTDLGFVKGNGSATKPTLSTVSTPRFDTGSTQGTTTLIPLFTGTTSKGCRDTYVWIADGSVDCKYLYTPSVYGLHTRAKFHCTKDPLTQCCVTCLRLGFDRRSSASTTPYTGSPLKPETSTTPIKSGKKMPISKTSEKIISVILKTIKEPKSIKG